MGVWIAAVGIFGTGGALVWEGVKGLSAQPDKKGRKPSKGTSYATIVVGVIIMVVGAAVPFVA